MSYLDLGIIILLVVGVAFGIFKGFLRKYSVTFAIYTGLGISYFISTPIHNALYKNGLYNWIFEKIEWDPELFLRIIGIIVFILVGIIIFLIVFIIIKIIGNKLLKFKTMNVVDRIVGGIAGGISALFTACTILFLLGFIGSYAEGLATWFADDIAKSFGLARELAKFANYYMSNLGMPL